MLWNRYTKLIAGALASSMITLPSIAGADQVASKSNKGRNYSVTITNLTGGQLLTPALVVSHNHNYHLFTIGEEASAGLATLAETGNPADAAADAASMSSVFRTNTDTMPIHPGQTRTVMIRNKNKYGHITVAGMLATTNDGFYALDGAHIPKKGSETYYVHVYDAGSEENNEMCAYIPGPPCPMDSGNKRATGEAEGKVVMHNGIHNGDEYIMPEHQDWRGPVAKITITRVK